MHNFHCLANIHRYRSGDPYRARTTSAWSIHKDTCVGGEMIVGTPLSREAVQIGLMYDAFTDGTQFEHHGIIYEVKERRLVVCT